MTSRYITKNDRPNLLNQLVLIDEIELTSNSAEIVFTDIPDIYRDLVITGRTRVTNDVTLHDLLINVGADASLDVSAKYRFSRHYLASPADTHTTNSGTGMTNMEIGSCPGASGDAGVYGSLEGAISDYSGSSYFKPMIFTSGAKYSATDGMTSLAHGSWDQLSPINVVSLRPKTSGSFAAGTKISLYGRGLRDGATVNDLEDLLLSPPEVWNWDGTKYVEVSGHRTFLGPNDPTLEGFIMQDGDRWEYRA